MKIVYICECLTKVGGTERVLTNKINYLSDVYGYEAYLITSCQGSIPFSFPVSSKVVHEDVDVRLFNQSKYKFIKRRIVAHNLRLKLRRELQRCVDKIKPDIIIGLSYYEPQTICQLNTNAKVIIESHVSIKHTPEVDGIRRNFVKKRLVEWLFRYRISYVKRKCDKIIVLTEADKRDWKVEESRIKIIPDPITMISERYSDCSAHMVICAGRLKAQKGYDRMVDAWAMVNSKHKDWQLRIFGEGEEEQSLRKQITRLGLNATVKILPFPRNIYEEYIKSSIFVLSSRYEGFGLVLIEAMECGVPCVSFDCPCGPSEIIKDKEDGLLVENGNVEALADAICWMMEHDDERKAMGKRAKENVKRFSLDVVMPQWRKLFNEITTQ